MRIFLFLFVSLWVAPRLALGFSETELNSLEATGKKQSSVSPWRTEIQLLLQRNLDLKISYETVGDQKQRSRFAGLLDSKKTSSFVNLENLYWTLSFAINYSLSDLKFLKNSELFLAGYLNNSLKGQNSHKAKYDYKYYMRESIGDLRLGLTSPLYAKNNFLSYSSFSLLAPISRFARRGGLITRSEARIDLLYFLTKKAKQSISLSSGHSLSYSHWTKKIASPEGQTYNIPLDSRQNLSWIYRQSYSPYLPHSTALSASYSLGINYKKSLLQNVALGGSLSWKLRDRLYFVFSARWKDRVKKNKPLSAIRFKWQKTFFSIGTSFSF